MFLFITLIGIGFKFAASVRVEVGAGTKIKDKSTGEIVGRLIRLKIPKNKVAPPFRSLETEMRFGKGIHRPLDLLIQAIFYGIIEMRGASYLYDGSLFARGKDNAYKALMDSPDLCDKIEKELREKVLPGRG